MRRCRRGVRSRKGAPRPVRRATARGRWRHALGERRRRRPAEACRADRAGREPRAGAGAAAARSLPTSAAAPTARGAARRPGGGRRQALTAAAPRTAAACRAAGASAVAASRSAAPGPVAAPGGPRATSPEGLGGEQVEGRQAVRELLMAGTRKVREVWVASDLEDTGVIADIVDLAAAAARPRAGGQPASKLEAEARSEAPQGVLAKAAPLREADLDDLAPRPDPGARPVPRGRRRRHRSGQPGCPAALGRGCGRHRRRAAAAPGRARHADGRQGGRRRHRARSDGGGAGPAGRRSGVREQLGSGSWVSTTPPTARCSSSATSAASRSCLVLGAEGAGCRGSSASGATSSSAIPMLGRLSSLNVSAAAALACYEVARQRALA